MGRRSSKVRVESKVVWFSDGTYARITRVSETRRTRIPAEIRRYIEFMFDKLLEWLEDDEVWYDSFDEMLDDAKDYIYEEMLRAPDDADVIPCDHGSLSIAMFVDYVFNGELPDDGNIADDISYVFEPENLLECIEVGECYKELLRFRDALSSVIKVKVYGRNYYQKAGRDNS
jgi:hypothetical protein